MTLSWTLVAVSAVVNVADDGSPTLGLISLSPAVLQMLWAYQTLSLLEPPSRNTPADLKRVNRAQQLLRTAAACLFVAAFASSLRLGLLHVGSLAELAKVLAQIVGAAAAFLFFAGLWAAANALCNVETQQALTKHTEYGTFLLMLFAPISALEIRRRLSKLRLA